MEMKAFHCMFRKQTIVNRFNDLFSQLAGASYAGKTYDMEQFELTK